MWWSWYQDVAQLQIHMDEHWECVTDESQHHFCQHAFFLQGYEGAFWFWELVVLGRKVATFAIFTLAPSSSNGALQSTLILFLLVISVSAQTYYKPYKNDTLDKVEIWTLLTATFGHLLASFVDLEQHNANDPHLSNFGIQVASVVFIIVFGTYTVYFLYYLLPAIYQELYGEPNEPEKKPAREPAVNSDGEGSEEEEEEARQNFIVRGYMACFMYTCDCGWGAAPEEEHDEEHEAEEIDATPWPPPGASPGSKCAGEIELQANPLAGTAPLSPPASPPASPPESPKGADEAEDDLDGECKQGTALELEHAFARATGHFKSVFNSRPPIMQIDLPSFDGDDEEAEPLSPAKGSVALEVKSV